MIARDDVIKTIEREHYVDITEAHMRRSPGDGTMEIVHATVRGRDRMQTFLVCRVTGTVRVLL